MFGSGCRGLEIPRRSEEVDVRLSGPKKASGHSRNGLNADILIGQLDDTLKSHVVVLFVSREDGPAYCKKKKKGRKRRRKKKRRRRRRENRKKSAADEEARVRLECDMRGLLMTAHS